MYKKRWIAGKHTVEIALADPSSLICLYVAENKQNDPLTVKALKLGVKVAVKPLPFLSKVSGTEVTQGFVAETSKMPETSLQEFLERFREKKSSILIAIDSIEDPQNLGGVLRACECLGAAGVLYSRNRGSPLSATASKASSGASEVVPLCEVGNLAEAIRSCQEEGYFVQATAISEYAQDAFTYSFPEKSLLILGAEGSGVRPLLRKIADTELYLPMSGLIDSLNVGQSAVSFLTLWRKQWT